MFYVLVPKLLEWTACSFYKFLINGPYTESVFCTASYALLLQLVSCLRCIWGLLMFYFLGSFFFRDGSKHQSKNMIRVKGENALTVSKQS